MEKTDAKIKKIALCLPLLFLDIDQLPQNSSSNVIDTANNYLNTGWGWRFSVNSAHASDVERIPVYGTRPPSWGGGWGSGSWDQTEQHCWYCDDTDYGGGDYYTPEPQPSPDNEAWTASEVTTLTKLFTELKLALAKDLASVDLKDPRLISELSRQHKAVSLALEVLQGGGQHYQ